MKTQLYNKVYSDRCYYHLGIEATMFSNTYILCCFAYLQSLISSVKFNNLSKLFLERK